MKILIVGAGCCGASAARSLAEKGWDITLIDRRAHIGGNTYDQYNECGQLYHCYGPHVFFTNKEDVWSFLLPFGPWVPYRSMVGVELDGQIHPMPFQTSTLSALTGNTHLQTELSAEFVGRTSVQVYDLLNSKNPAIRQAGIQLYEKDCVPYNKKQWNLSPDELLTEVLARAPVFIQPQEQFRQEKWQYMPLLGFTDLFLKMLNHSNIHLKLNTNASECFTVSETNTIFWKKDSYDCILYTGTLDELFSFRFGRLPYRSLQFKAEQVDGQNGLPYFAVYYPDERLPYTRRTDYSYLPGNGGCSHMIISEIPVEWRPGLEPFYVIRTAQSEACSEQYRKLASTIPHFYFSGRLAEFRYLNIDDAIQAGLRIAEQIDRAETERV